MWIVMGDRVSSMVLTAGRNQFIEFLEFCFDFAQLIQAVLNVFNLGIIQSASPIWKEQPNAYEGFLGG